MPYNINSGYGAVSAHSVTGASGPIGKTFHVCKAGSNAYAYLSALYPVDSDGVVRVYAADGVADDVEIQAAIDAAKGGTNAYVFIYSGNYALTAAVTMAGKSSLHLVGVNGGGCEVGTVGAAAFTQGGDFPCIIMEAYGEVTGLQLINHPAYPAITIPANIWRVNIHNNFIWGGGAGACSYIDATAAAAGSYSFISNNRFSITGAATAAINVGTGTGLTISKNIITQYNGTLDLGIKVNGAQCIISNNYISNSGGAGAITVAITCYQYSAAIGNRCAVGAGAALDGGTAANSYVDNMDAATGAGNGSASNLET